MKMNEIRPIELRIFKSDFSSVKNNEDIKNALEKIYNGQSDSRAIHVDKNLDLEALTEFLESEGLTVSRGISEGCYGARTGKQLEGLTLWAPLENFNEFLDVEYFQYCINPLDSIYEYGGTLLNYDSDFIENLLDFNYEVNGYNKSDNTYNYELENAYFLTDINFEILEYENATILCARFHCGGDIRGNYTGYYAFKFDSIDDALCAMSPYREDIPMELKVEKFLENIGAIDVSINWPSENEDFSNDINGLCDFSGLHSSVLDVEYLDDKRQVISSGKLDRSLCIAIENADFSGLE